MTKRPARCTCLGPRGFGPTQGACLRDLSFLVTPSAGASGRGRRVTQGEQLAAASLAGGLPRSARLSCLCPASAEKSRQSAERSRRRRGPCRVLREGGCSHPLLSAAAPATSLGTGNPHLEGLVSTALGSSRDPQQGLNQSGPSGQTLELPAASQIPEGWSGTLLLFGVSLLLITDCVGVGKTAESFQASVSSSVKWAHNEHSGLNCVPPYLHVEVATAGPQNGTVSEDTVFKRLIHIK